MNIAIQKLLKIDKHLLDASLKVSNANEYLSDSN